jgi:heme-degrading monooxygenase HmoA
MSSNPKPITTSPQRIFIDRFVVPERSSAEFFERMNINRQLLKTLTGFVEDQAYIRNDDQGNLVCITVAVWETDEAIANAREKVQAEYRKEGFNMVAMLERLGITMSERGIYVRQ